MLRAGRSEKPAGWVTASGGRGESDLRLAQRPRCFSPTRARVRTLARGVWRGGAGRL